MLLCCVFTHFSVYYCGTEDQDLVGMSLLLFQTTILSGPCFREVLLVSFINIHVFFFALRSFFLKEERKANKVNLQVVLNGNF